MTFQFGKGGRGDGNVMFQQIQRQFADGIDLIRVGMLQQRLTRMATALSQHLLEKGSLSPYSFHGNPPHTMTTRRYHSQYFIDNHVYERFLGHGHASDETQQGGSLVQKLSVHQADSLVQQLQQWFPSPPHASNETPQRRVLFHRYPSSTLDDVARLEGSRLGTLRNLLSSLLLSLGFSRRRFDDTFLLHPVRLFALREGFDGLRCRRCICRGGEYCSSRHVASSECRLPTRYLLCMLPVTGGGCSTHGPPHYVRKPLGSPFRCFLLTGQRLFNPVPCCTADSSQRSGFARSNGGRYECQERKESTSLTSLFATDTTHGPSPSSTFGRHDVFETMKGTRCRHAHLGFFPSVPRRCRRRRRRRRCPPLPAAGILGAKRGR